MKNHQQKSLIGSVILLAALLLLPACSVSTFGKFQYEKGMPSFIKTGETSRKEVFDKLGEPLVHRFVAGKETAIYISEQGYFWFVYGTYEGHELVICFENDIVSDARIEQTGTGWGFFAPANANNPGTLRSSR
jgi:outer membrane protein assembly factor BamE (lipoprotein component of BamABCDE complex)